jgi:outer membrane protein assembly factor BamB
MQHHNGGGSQRASDARPGLPQPDSGTPTTRRRFLALAGAGTAAVVLARDSSSWAANRPGLRSFNSTTVSNGVQQFHSRPDLLPPQVVVDKQANGQLAGSIVTEVHGGASQSGPLIFDQHGRIIWFNPLSPQPTAEHRAFNVQVAKYDGKPVLAWFEGAVVAAHGQGTYQIVDTRYRPVAQVQAQGGYVGDLHELILTPQGTALFTCYAPAQGKVLVNGVMEAVPYWCGVVQEVDIATGKLLFQWRSDQHVPLDYSYIGPGVRLGGYWDYFHINAITIDPADQNLVISSRNTATLYKVNRKTGRVMWRMGGKHNQFRRGKGTHFAFQHDVRLWPGGVMTVFDNEGGPPRFGPQSRALTLAVDEKRLRVQLIRADLHTPPIYSAALGSVQPLSGGDVFVGWGTSSYFTQYDPSGRVLFDGYLATGGSQGASSYRAFLQPWNGIPTAPPDIAVVRSQGNATVYASWNGASALSRWIVLGGPSHSEMSQLGTANVAGFETGIPLNTSPAAIAVSAVDADGRVLATSNAVTS